LRCRHHHHDARSPARPPAHTALWHPSVRRCSSVVSETIKAKHWVYVRKYSTDENTKYTSLKPKWVLYFSHCVQSLTLHMPIVVTEHVHRSHRWVCDPANMFLTSKFRLRTWFPTPSIKLKLRL
jgi:hypothetical protein